MKLGFEFSAQNRLHDSIGESIVGSWVRLSQSKEEFAAVNPWKRLICRYITVDSRHLSLRLNVMLSHSCLNIVSQSILQPPADDNRLVTVIEKGTLYLRYPMV